jgi:hypothetical protein
MAAGRMDELDWHGCRLEGFKHHDQPALRQSRLGLVGEDATRPSPATAASTAASAVETLSRGRTATLTSPNRQ